MTVLTFTGEDSATAMEKMADQLGRKLLHSIDDQARQSDRD